MPSSGCLRVERERLLARVYPRASADPSLVYHYNTDTGAFALQAHGGPGDPPTVVYVPPEVTGQISSVGASTTPSIRINPDGSRLVTLTPAGGAFSVVVAPATLALTGCL